MPSPNPNNRVDRNKSNNNGQKSQIFMKDRLKNFGANIALKKISVSGLVAVDRIKFEGIVVVMKIMEIKGRNGQKLLNQKLLPQRMKFDFHTPEVNEGKIHIKPPLSVDLQGRKAWKNCLVGYFFETELHAFHTMEYHDNRK